MFRRTPKLRCSRAQVLRRPAAAAAAAALCGARGRVLAQRALQEASGFSEAAEGKNRLRRMLRSFFPARDCFTLVRGGSAVVFGRLCVRARA